MSSGKPVAVVTGGAGFIGSHMVDALLGAGYARPRHRQSGRRPSQQSRSSQGQSGSRLLLAAISGSSTPDSPIFARREIRLPLRRHRRHRALDRAADASTWTPTSRAPCACSKRARRPASRSSSMRRRRRATGWPPCRRAKTMPIDPQYPYALSQISGRAGGVSLAPGLRAAGQLDPHLQCLWPARAHDGRLWRGVRRILPAETRRQAVHRGRRRHAAPRLHLRHRRRAGVPAPRPRRRLSGERLQCRRRQPAVGQPAGRAARRRRRVHAQTSGRARLHLGRHRARSRASSAGSRSSRSRKASRGCWPTSSTGATRRCGIPTRSQRRPRPGFEYLGKQSA